MYEPKPEPSFTASPTEIASGMVRKPSVRARNPIPTTSPTGPERNSTRVSLLIQRSQVLKCRGSSRIARAVVGPRARHLALLSGTRARSSHTARLARGGLERAVGVGHGPTEKNRAPNKPAGRSFATSRTCPFRRRSDVRDAPFRCFVCLTFAATHAPDDSRNGTPETVSRHPESRWGSWRLLRRFTCLLSLSVVSFSCRLSLAVRRRC